MNRILFSINAKVKKKCSQPGSFMLKEIALSVGNNLENCLTFLLNFKTALKIE